ncbi:unnamed protein product [Blepharisma stoltei]|uniref:Uncharacterized protein n=1 Tax=Blepharisma stoltei TaxID=1481888 RepID=A0AAU9IY86_9CILI|nr:unnamed protein product [Blepharisma stoltei]
MHKFNANFLTYWSKILSFKYICKNFMQKSTNRADDLTLGEVDILDFLDFPPPLPTRSHEVARDAEETYTDIKSTGRKQIVDTKILGRFQSSSNPYPPKKEYLRCKMIRGHKRANRQIEKSVIPKRTINAYSSIAEVYWSKLAACFNAHKDVLIEESKTEAGPKTDGKTKRNCNENNIPKSFNEKFCKRYFSPEEVRESYFYYTEYIFAEFDPDVMCKKFKLRCCRSPIHNSECFESWKLLKFYVQKIMLDNLGVEPWIVMEATTDVSTMPNPMPQIVVETKIAESEIKKVEPQQINDPLENIFREIDGDIDPELFFNF